MQWDNVFGGGIWALVVVGGPIILGLVLLYASLNNRRSKAEKRRTEAATRELREEIKEDDESRRP